MANPNRQLWNEKFKILQNTWPRPVDFQNCMELCLNLHAMVHSKEMSNSHLWSFEDELWDGLTEIIFRRVYKGDQSIAWKMWHCSRIEDIAMNILAAGEPQVLNTGGWFEKMGVAARDTGNSMNEEEIKALSESIDLHALRGYRMEVGRKTRSIIKGLLPEELKQKIEPSRLQTVLAEGAVTEESKWLLDYWGKKTKAGLLLMPAIRHIFVDLNESTRIKEKESRQQVKPRLNTLQNQKRK